MGQDVVYRVDRNDILLTVNDAWDAFALENDGADLIRDNVVGKSIWSFMHDDDARHIHQLLTDKVRAGRKVAGLRFRCDSPSSRRHMEMDISLLNMGEVEYRCRFLRVEGREPVPMAGDDADAHITMCSWCKKVNDGGQWLELEEAVKALKLFEREKMPLISHGMCDACLNKLQDI